MPDLPEQSIFIQALGRDAGHRGAFLDEACASDPALRARVERLLHHHEHAASFLAAPAVGSPEPRVDADATVERPMREGPGTAIGPYKLLQQIGEGGMGVVFLAEQTRPVRRQVALKVIKAGMDTRQVIARFEAERQALAMMDHVNIARVLDAGATDSGLPYFVMELVHGVPITKYCDDNHLTPRQRLELFVPVCQAIQHAHQKGIIHRDVKPSNVMITLYDGKPVPKVIDFGVAKATEQRLTERTLFTNYGTIVGTLEYMSPEQAEASALGADTRSDIFSLGVLMYELLTGSTPLSHKRLREAAYAEVLRMIKEEEPPRPSTRLSDSGEALASISARRHMGPAELTKLVRGELDWIVMKCLEKDRGRRYETAGGFAADVQRYLNDEPVQAVPPSAAYRVRKFARRNRAGLVTTSVIGVALLLAVGSFGWAVRDRQAGRARTAAEVDQFLQRAESLYAENKLPEATAEVQKARGVLEAGTGDAHLGGRVRRWLADLDTAAKLEEIPLEHRTATDPGRERAVFARVFRDYGIDVEALPAEEAAARVAASQIKLDLTLALVTWASSLQFDPRLQEPARWNRLLEIARAADPDPWRLRLLAAVEAKDVQALRELAAGADPRRLRTRTLAHLSGSLKDAGDPGAAVAFLRKVQRQHPSDFLVNTSLFSSLRELNPPLLAEATAFQRAALAVRPRSASVQSNLGVALADQDKLDDAVACYKRAIELDPKHAIAYNNLGNALHDQKKPEQAIAWFIKAIEVDPNYAAAYSNLGIVLSDQDKWDQAVAWFNKAIEVDPTLAAAYCNLGTALCDQDKWDQAVAACRKAIELDPRLASAHSNLGRARHGQERRDDAVACYKRAIELDPKHAIAYNGLGSALHDQNELAEAVAAFRKAIELDPNFASAHSNLGGALQAQGKPDEAVAAYRKAIELDPKSAYIHDNLGLALQANGKLDEAVAAHREAIELDPKLAAAHVNLGAALGKQNKLDEAVAAFRKAIELDPNDPVARSNLDSALKAQGKPDRAD